MQLQQDRFISMILLIPKNYNSFGVPPPLWAAGTLRRSCMQLLGKAHSSEERRMRQLSFQLQGSVVK